MRSILNDRNVAFLIICFLVLGCGAGRLQSIEADKEVGKETAKAVQYQMGVVDNPKLTSYINRIGTRLLMGIPNRQFNYQFAIVDQPEPNAFAAPGGYIYVSRGFLALANSEAEIANVLAHEIIHVNRRHTAKQLAKQRLPSLLQLPGEVVGGVIGGPLGEIIRSPFATFSAAYMASHSREHELEADELGIQLAAHSGYPPQSMGAILDRLKKENEIRTGEIARPDFFSTHPSTPKRVSEVYSLSRKIRWTAKANIARDRTGFFRNLDGILVGPNPAEGVLVEGKFLHPELDLHLAFPKGWLTVNTKLAVGGMAPQKDALLVLGTPEKGTNPEQNAKQFSEAFYKSFRVKPTRSRKVQINGRQGFLVSYWDRSAKDPVYLHFLWIAKRGLIYPLMGMAKKDNAEKLKKSALTFRSLKPSERKLIKEYRLKVVSARKGESLKNLRQRTGSVWNVKTIAIYNGFSTDQRLKDGQFVKIAVSNPYRSKRN